MIKNKFVVLLLLLVSHLVLSQGYDMTVKIIDVDCGCADTYHSGEIIIAGQSTKTFGSRTPISVSSYSLPSSLSEITIDIEVNDDIFPCRCRYGQVLSFKPNFKSSSGCQVQTLTKGTPEVTIEVTWTPKDWEINEPTRNSGGIYCADGNIELNASIDYGNYIWEYSLNGISGWNRISGSTSASFMNSAQGIFGTGISTIYGRPVFFSARFGDCNREISDSYTFYQAAPSGFTVNTNPQSSTCVSDGEVILTFPIDSNYNGEELEVEISNGPIPTESYTFLVSSATEYTFNSSSIPVALPPHPPKIPQFNNDTPWTIIITNSLTASDNSDEDFVNSCSTYPGYDFTFDPPPTFAYGNIPIVRTKNITCANSQGTSNDGKITVTVENGNNNDYEYKLMRANIGTAAYTSLTPVASDQTSYTFSNLTAGDYKAVVTDGCNDALSETSIVTLDRTAISITQDRVDAETCSYDDDGSIYISASGTGTLTYLWSSGETTQDVVDRLTGSSLGIGKKYTVTVTDGGCEATRDFYVKEPLPVTFTDPNGAKVNAECDGDLGRITITNPSGGTGSGYEYSINNGGNYVSTNIFAVIAGTYQTRVKDDDGCESDPIEVEITDPAPITFLHTKSDVKCNGGNDGEITISSPSGGSNTGFKYSIGSTSYVDDNVFQMLVSGVYSVSVKDSEGCVSDIVSVNIGQPSPLTGSISETSSISCKGESDGVLTANPTGGTSPTSTYSYLWSHGTNPTTRVVSGLSIGDYSVEVTDANGCKTTLLYTLGEPLELSALVGTISDYNGYEISCQGESDGSIQINPSGGTTPYSYQWSGNSTATTQDLSGVTAGIYNVVITDQNGCTFAINGIELTEPTVLGGSSDIPTYNGFEISCNGGSDGAIDVTVSGGVAPYSYLWSGSSTATTQDLSNQSAGTYSLTITDANGCAFPLSPITMEAPTVLAATTSTVRVTCFGDADGSITATPSGGVLDYEYSIDGGINYQPENIFSGLATGTYTITIRDSNGCEITRDGTVATPNPIAGSIILDTPISCKGDSDGVLSISVGGGTDPLNYLWSTGAITTSISDLPAGDYDVLVTDSNSCTETFYYTLTEPDVLEISGDITTHVSCHGGSDGAIDITVQGGTLPYGYSWDNGAITEDISGVDVGNYIVSITDARGCFTSQSYTITAPDLLVLSVDQINNVSCFLGSDGSGTLLATGGVSAYEYSIDGINWQPSHIITGLTVGSYTFYVQDANGCISTAMDIVTEPTLLEASTQNIVNTTCGFPIGSAESLVTGGTVPYSYSWADAFSNEVSTDEHISNTLSGVYTVAVTDAKGCTQSALAVISNTDGADYTVSNIQPALCHDSADGQATVTINSVVMPYEILWSNGETTEIATGLVAGINIVTLTDGNNCDVTQTVMVGAPIALGVSIVSEQYPSCNGVADAVTVIEGIGGTAPYAYTWNNGQTGNTLSNIGAGDYQLTIVDAHACEDVFTITVQETPVLEVLVVESTTPVCTSGSDGILEVTGQSGTAPYSYDWGSLGTAARIDDLPSGDYPITIVDANGCTTSTILVLTDPALLNYTVISESTPTCNGVMNGFIEIAGVNGAAPYTYQWATGASGSRLQSIAGRDYEVVISDANGCTNTLTVPFEEPEVLAVGVTAQTDPSCHGFNNGQIEVLATGGTTPYFYNWSTGVTGSSLNNVVAGTYEVNVSDVNGCSTSISVTLAEPEPLAISVIDFVLPTCYDTDDGVIEIDIAGGTAPYVTSWNTGSSNNRIALLIQGAYEVTITDAQGCVLTEIISLTGVEATQAIVTTTDPLCYGYDDGAISLTTTGGTGTLSYLWNDDITDANRSSLPSGDYSVVITDQNECTRDIEVKLTDPEQIVFDLPDAEICVGGNHRATLDLGSGYAYTWTLGNGFTTTGDVVNLDQTGDYTVVATDRQGCFGEDAFSISTNEGLLQADFLVTSESYVGDTVVIIDISWPLPENVLWGFDEDVVTVLNNSNDYLELVFTEEGTYQITQEVTLAECADYLAQGITIFGAGDKEDSQGGREANDNESLITSLKLYPNPTDGQFSVEVVLSRAATINLRIINATNNRQVFSEQKSGNDHYTLGYSLSNRLQPGIYFIVVAAEGQLETIRLMVR